MLPTAHPAALAEFALQRPCRQQGLSAKSSVSMNTRWYFQFIQAPAETQNLAKEHAQGCNGLHVQHRKILA